MLYAGEDRVLASKFTAYHEGTHCDQYKVMAKIIRSLEGQLDEKVVIDRYQKNYIEHTGETLTHAEVRSLVNSVVQEGMADAAAAFYFLKDAYETKVDSTITKARNYVSKVIDARLASDPTRYIVGVDLMQALLSQPQKFVVSTADKDIFEFSTQATASAFIERHRKP